jgi:hypothetical protein
MSYQYTVVGSISVGNDIGDQDIQIDIYLGYNKVESKRVSDLSAETLMQYIRSFTVFSEHYKLVNGAIHRKLATIAKNKIKDLRDQIDCYHNLRLYCLISPNSYLVGHKFMNNAISNYFENSLMVYYFGKGSPINFQMQHTFRCLDCPLNASARFVEQISIDQLVDIYRYLIAKTLCQLIELFGWDLSWMIIDCLV